MVVFVDLDADDEPRPITYGGDGPLHGRPLAGRAASDGFKGKAAVDLLEESNQHSSANRGDAFAAALGCYPVALSLASHLDLNDLYALSLTSRLIHNSLSQFSHQLVSQSLRCLHDGQVLLSDAVKRHREVQSSAADHDLRTDMSDDTPPADHDLGRATPDLTARLQSPLGLAPKIGACARDLVAACRRCGTVVCRNCAAKPPSDKGLRDRFRRLCQTCLDAPLSDHLQKSGNAVLVSDSPLASSASSTRSIRSGSGSSTATASADEAIDVELPHTFTTPAFLRDPCTCSTRGVYLCQPCGQNLRAGDTTYRRVWTWRSRYSTHIGGGLGTGLGVGNQGQKCARGEACLDGGHAGICWVEIDCSEDQSRDDESGLLGASSTPSTAVEGLGTFSHKPGYLSQEIEGIGGVVKKKVKKRVKVGATVWEFDDERKTGRYLEREAREQQRSWCGWCYRVCLGEDDRRRRDGQTGA